MIKLIDNFLNRITMYRLVMYFLMLLILQAAIFSAFKIVRFNPLEIAASALVLTVVCLVANYSLARIFNAHPNVESVYITALILALIINPAQTGHGYLFLVWAGVLAMASKFILSIGKKHIFNPAAIAVVITSYALGQYASWWVGTAWMLPLVVVGGALIIRKVQSLDMVFSFFAVTIALSSSLAFFGGSDVVRLLKQMVLDTPLFFFSSIMLTEPLTAPPTKKLQAWYGALVGILFAPQVHILSLYFTPEMALCAGNIFAYVVSPKQKLLLTLKEKVKLSDDIYNFIFTAEQKLKFKAGQYLEWTLAHKNPDGRGNRRYFTVASSPTEGEIIMGVKFYQPSSSFKKSLLSMQPGDKIMAGQLAGEFTLPKEQKKFVFIAGGIGITPFRSMVKNLVDKNEKRDITIFFANKTPRDIVYKEILEQAEKNLGIKTIYAVNSVGQEADWSGEVGFINAEMIKSKLPDYKDRTYYISGPRSMTEAFEKTLKDMGIKSSDIKVDFFPGFV